MVTRTRLHVTLYVHCYRCLDCRKAASSEAQFTWRDNNSQNALYVPSITLAFPLRATCNIASRWTCHAAYRQPPDQLLRRQNTSCTSTRPTANSFRRLSSQSQINPLKTKWNSSLSNAPQFPKARSFWKVSSRALLLSMQRQHDRTDTNTAKRKNAVTKPVPVPLCAPQISQRQPWDRNPTSAVRGFSLTVKAIARPFKD